MKMLKGLALVAGALLFTYLLLRIGLGTIVATIVGLGWWSAPILGVGLAWYLLYALAWQRIARRHRHISLWRIFRLKIVGEAINTMTPANFLGGDPVRIYLLKRYLPWTHGAATVVIDRMLHSMATLAFIIVGAIVTFWHIHHLPNNIRYGLPVVLSIATGFTAFLFLHQRRGFIGFAITWLKRLHIRRHFDPRTLTRAQEIDAHIAAFYHHDPAGFWWALAYHWIGRCLGIVEIYVIGHVADAQFGWVESLILGALAPLIHLLFSFVPGALGVMEGAYSGALYLLHFSPSLGIAIQIVKRVRATLWTALGFIFLSAHDRRKVWEESSGEMRY